jgi:hypothetical protein
MLPESLAPDLPGLEEMRRWAEETPVEVRREYQPETEYADAYWQVFMVREERRFDGKLYAYMTTVSDEAVTRGPAEVWDTVLELHTMGWERLLDENRVSDEDERLAEIRADHDGDLDVAFLLTVVDRLKEEEAKLREALKEEWKYGAELREKIEKAS